MNGTGRIESTALQSTTIRQSKIINRQCIGAELQSPHAYPEPFIAPMRAELTNAGARELRTSDDVDAVLREKGTVMIVVNSVCGCAAERRGRALRLRCSMRGGPTWWAPCSPAPTSTRPRAREAFAPYPPSSPSVGLLRDGKLVYMLERRQIETRDAASIASMLRAAFDEHCSVMQNAAQNSAVTALEPNVPVSF